MDHVYFVSGHLDLTSEEFEAHYVPQLEELLLARFVVGDARGADLLTQEYLASQGVYAVTVFHLYDSPRNNPYGFPTKGGFRSDQSRDYAMTQASTHDIGWVRPGREKSGTARNLARREKVKEGVTFVAEGLPDPSTPIVVEPGIGVFNPRGLARVTIPNVDQKPSRKN